MGFVLDHIVGDPKLIGQRDSDVSQVACCVEVEEAVSVEENRVGRARRDVRLLSRALFGKVRGVLHRRNRFFPTTVAQVRPSR